MTHFIKLSHSQCQPSSQPLWVGKCGKVNLTSHPKWTMYPNQTKSQPSFSEQPHHLLKTIPLQISSIHNTRYNYSTFVLLRYPTKSFIRSFYILRLQPTAWIYYKITQIFGNGQTHYFTCHSYFILYHLINLSNSKLQSSNSFDANHGTLA